MNLRDKYAVVGIGYTPQGRVPDRTALSFHVEACANAVKDAGLKREDIDGLIVYRHFEPLQGEVEVTSFLVAQQLGLAPKLLSQESDCARTHLYHAICALEAGLCNYVLVSYGDNALSGGRTFGRTFHDDPIFGQFGAAAGYAMAARRGMHVFHTGAETWKEIAVAQRKWANLNTRAMMHGHAMTFEDYYNSKWVVEPFRLCDCCLVSDGGRAYIVTSVDRAKDLKHPPAVIMGIGQHHPSSSIAQATYITGPTGAKVAGEMAFKMAEITIDDIDACEIYDCFTYTVELTLQDYGFFKPGEGREWFKDGTIAPGGRMPVNSSGGLLSEAYFMGLTPLTEGAMQIMNRCGERQLGSKTHTREPEIILCSDNGGTLQSHSCTILRKL
ncbi:MAG: thiolase family protein [Dehalococcoidia bacterium]|nr:thiolase family protein [Dehalococcoidia bacterium]